MWLLAPGQGYIPGHLVSLGVEAPLLSVLQLLLLLRLRETAGTIRAQRRGSNEIRRGRPPLKPFPSSSNHESQGKRNLKELDWPFRVRFSPQILARVILPNSRLMQMAKSGQSILHRTPCGR